MIHASGRIARLFAPLLLATFWLPAQEDRALPNAPVVFKESGLQKGDPQANLPAGWTVAVRLGNLDRTLKRLDQLVASFVVEEFLDARTDRALARTAPVTGLLASASKLGSLEQDAVQRRSGLDTARPFYLAWYAPERFPQGGAQIDTGLLIALPWSGNLQTAAAFVTGLLNGEDLRNETFAGRPGVSLRVPGWSQRACFLFSADYLYLCSSPRVAALLTGAGSRFPLEPLAKVFAAPQAPDLLAVANFSVLKTFAFSASQEAEGEIKQYVSSLSNSLANLSTTQRGGLARTFRKLLGIASPEAGVAVVDCLLTAVSLELLPEIRWVAANLHGLALSVDFGSERQRLGVSLYRSTLDRGEAKGASIDLTSDLQKAMSAFYRPDAKSAPLPAPIPLDPVRLALASVPGARDTVLIQGREVPGEGPVLLSRVVERAAASAEARGIQWPVLSRLREWLRLYRRTPSLQSRLPWAISFRNEAQARPAALPPTPTSFDRQWALALARWREPWTTLFPAAESGAPQRYLAELAMAQTGNEQAWDMLWNGAQTNQDLIAHSSRMRVEKPVGRANVLAYEDVLSSRFGLFGYDQHELVSRRHYFLRPQGSYVFMQQAREPSAWLASEQAPACLAPDAGLLALLASVPEGAHFIAVDRRLTRLGPMLSEIGQLEDTLVAEIDAFLRKAQKLVDESGGDDSLLRDRAAGLEPPIYITELYLGEDRKVRCGVGGKLGIYFPRPRLMAPLRDLLREASNPDQLPGGMVFSYGAYSDRHEIVYQQDLRGAARLWRDVAKRFWEKYPGADLDAKLASLLRTLGLSGESRPGVLIASWTPDAYGLGSLVKLLDKLK
jgi:hypothetical protein